MPTIPATFEEIQGFIHEQERIITKSIKNDGTLRKMIDKNQINISNEELDKILNKVNNEIKRKYRMGWFTQQGRFQITRQVIQIERESNKEKIGKIEDINSILNIFEDRINYINEKEEADGEDENIVLRDDILRLIGEIPDSNSLKTNDIELIGNYDEIRDKLKANINSIQKINDSIEKLDRLNNRIEEGVSRNEDIKESIQVQERITKEIEKMRYLIASIKHKNESRDI